MTTTPPPLLQAPGSLQLEFEVLGVSEVLGNKSLLDDWNTFLHEHNHYQALHSSPEWFSAVVPAEDPDLFRLVMARDMAGEIQMILPVMKKRYSLKFDVYSRVLFSKLFDVVELMGGTPVADDTAISHWHDQLLTHLVTVWPDVSGLYIESVPLDSAWSECLHKHEQSKSSDYFLASLYGIRPWYRMELHDSMDTFLKDLGTKQRYNLKRVVKRLHKAGEVAVHHCCKPEDVDSFLHAAEAISRQTWQFEKIGMHVCNDEQTRTRHQQLAEAGILRSYYLEFDGAPIAYITGHQGHGVYHQHEIGYIKSKMELAPGIALFYAALEDLHATDRPTHIDFGVGFADYKKRYGNEESRDESIVLFKRTLANRFYIQSHQWFLAAIEWAKRVKAKKKA